MTKESSLSATDNQSAENEVAGFNDFQRMEGTPKSLGHDHNLGVGDRPDHSDAQNHSSFEFVVDNYDTLYSWMIVVISCIPIFNVFGSLQSWYDEGLVMHLLYKPSYAISITLLFLSIVSGVMQDYIVQHMTHNVSNAQTQVSFVATCAFVLTDSLAPFSTKILSTFGVRSTLAFGIIVTSVSMVGAGFATQIWHFYIAISLCYGIGMSSIFIVVYTIVPQWFDKQRSAAVAMISSSTNVGGMVFPYVMYAINGHLGSSWTFRIFGIAFLVLNLIACMLVKANPQYMAQIQGKKQGLGFLEFVTNANYMLWIAAALCQGICMLVPLIFLPPYATYIGLTGDKGSSLVLIWSAMNCIGKIVAGYVADRIGNLHAGIIFNVIAGLSSLLIWMKAYNYAVLISFAVVNGFFGATYFALMPTTVRSLIPPERYQAGFALNLVLVCPAFFGPTMISAIDDAANAEPFLAHRILTGVAPIVSVLIMTVLRFKISKKFISKV